MLLICGFSVSAADAATLPRVLTWAGDLKGSEEERMRWPVVAAAASDDDVAIGDAFGPSLIAFHKIGASWQMASVVELPGRPLGLIHDGSRYVATVRGVPSLILLEGEQLQQRRLGLPRGVIPGALARAANDGYLLWDYRARRVLHLSEDGELEREVSIDGRVTALAADRSGSFFVALADRGQVIQYDANWNPAGSWDLPNDGPVPAWPSGLAVEPTGDILVTDRHGSRILVLEAGGKIGGVGGRKGWESGLLYFPMGIALLPSGLVLVADEGNSRGEFFQRTDTTTGQPTE